MDSLPDEVLGQILVLAPVAVCTRWALIISALADEIMRRGLTIITSAGTYVGTIDDLASMKIRAETLLVVYRGGQCIDSDGGDLFQPRDEYGVAPGAHCIGRISWRFRYFTRVIAEIATDCDDLLLLRYDPRVVGFASAVVDMSGGGGDENESPGESSDESGHESASESTYPYTYGEMFARIDDVTFSITDRIQVSDQYPDAEIPADTARDYICMRRLTPDFLLKICPRGRTRWGRLRDDLGEDAAEVVLTA